MVAVRATGVCRSDWHGWMGHDPAIALPHVPGHELAGTVAAVGAGVRRWSVGDRVTVPFVNACGRCAECAAGEHQVCPHQEQPGFTHDGSFAELVAIRHARTNLVELPDDVSFDVAATLGCRYATAWRAVHRRARVVAGERVAVYGCGGLGLSAVVIASRAGAEVTAVDASPAALELATRLGAARTATEAVPDMHVALECSGHAGLADAALRALRRRGRHVQIGLLPGGAHVSMDAVIAGELPGFATPPLVAWATVVWSAFDYYRKHKRSHEDPEWAREHLPWHYDHHMGRDQNANWCVTHPFFDYVMGTRKEYLGVQPPAAQAEPALTLVPAPSAEPETVTAA